ncbi:UDP-glucose dehydrogenase family protein [Priestia filamentosa]|uniref:UDP-glucose dehydrogenase family protein n=1 Tax=Priestia filamentosa TaxID=1402861 RepID=UPI0002EF16BF|nr:UDP-glucose/GDP-mannose dehydrogenase family protein [Priestia filamentosa]
MKIAVVGTGYVGLVTGVTLSEIGHCVTCIDIDQTKVEKMKKGISPIYEPGLEELMKRNIKENNLFFTTNHREGFKDAEVIYIAVGTPEKKDGSADLSFIEEVAINIAQNINRNVIVVTKSTVPVGTNYHIEKIIKQNLVNDIKFDIVSNPEFLREGSAVFDAFNGDRIVIGADNNKAAQIIEEVNNNYGIPVFKTDIKSAEMIKYASNAFLATKISFINEISNICERLGADIEGVAQGMGLDNRIGSQFLNAGIGYGGSCFPKDTKALIQIAGNVDYEFELLKGVVKVNQKQQRILIEKLEQRFGELGNKVIGVLGLAFKPNTDDMREAPSIVIIKELLNKGAIVKVYDPIAIESAKKVLEPGVNYATSVDETLYNSDAVLILTEWDEFKEIDLSLFKQLMNQPIVVDGRNCFDLKGALENDIEYYSIGRKEINRKSEELESLSNSIR